MIRNRSISPSVREKAERSLTARQRRTVLALAKALARRGAGREERVDARQRRRVERDVRRARVLLDVRDALAARQRDDVVAAREQPREGELRGAHAVLARERGELVDEREVALEVAAVEARHAPPQIVLRRARCVERTAPVKMPRPSGA